MPQSETQRSDSSVKFVNFRRCIKALLQDTFVRTPVSGHLNAKCVKNNSLETILSTGTWKHIAKCLHFSAWGATKDSQMKRRGICMRNAAFRMLFVRKQFHWWTSLGWTRRRQTGEKLRCSTGQKRLSYTSNLTSRMRAHGHLLRSSIKDGSDAAARHNNFANVTSSHLIRYQKHCQRDNKCETAKLNFTPRFSFGIFETFSIFSN